MEMRNLDLAETNRIDCKKVSIKFTKFEVISVSVETDDDRRRFVAITYLIDGLQSIERRETFLSKSAKTFARIAKTCQIDAIESGSINDVTPRILLTLMTLDD